MKLVVEEYRKRFLTYENFTQKLHSLIAELLENEGIKTHLIESRVKDVNSFSEKITRPSKVYLDPLNDVTDLSGVRIIVYYNDDILKVAEILEQEFEKLECEDAHQAKNYEAESFGYLSLHYVVKINEIRSNLREWKRFKDIKSEIQIRTVLQHSWAAISHALQYKNESDVPKPLRRKLFRLAGLFELADEEFMSVRDEAITDKTEVKLSLASGDKDIAISPTSIEEFLSSWMLFKGILNFVEDLSFKVEPDGQSSEHNDYNDYEIYDDEEKDLDYYGVIASQCERIEVNTISQLETALEIDFKSYLTKLGATESEWRVSNSFILYLLIIRAKIEKFSAKVLIDEGWYDKIAMKVIKAAKEDKKANKMVKVDSELSSV